MTSRRRDASVPASGGDAPEGHAPAGIDDVARAAGVSATTVSRALSGRGRVSSATRARVAEAARRLGYVPSAAAASLASGRTRNIGVLVPLLDRWYFSTALGGMADVLPPAGYDMTLYHVTRDAAQRAEVFTTALRRGRVDAFVPLPVALADAEVAALTATGLPVLALGDASPRLPALRVDDVAVGRAATAHLLALGHRDIVHLGADHGRDGFDVAGQRRRGFEAAMTDAGVAAPRFVRTGVTIEDGHRATRALLAEPTRPTAIFAGSDEAAFGALFAAREAGLDVPGDLSVIGVDGHEMSAFFDLTTIDQFPRAQGAAVASAVLALLGEGVADSPATAGLPGILPFELVVRASTAPRAGR